MNIPVNSLSTVPDLEARTQAAIDAFDRDLFRELITNMVEIPSPTGEERPLAEYCARFMTDHGLKGEVQVISDTQANALGRLNGRSRGGPSVLIYGGPMDLAAILSGAAPGTHAYCCGPVPMLEASEAAAAARPPENHQVATIQAKEQPPLEGGVIVELAQSGGEYFIPEGATILDVLELAGLDIEHSCAEGICGSCKTGVLSGVPMHRDTVLTASERASNKVRMICCSGATSARLVLNR